MTGSEGLFFPVNGLLVCMDLYDGKEAAGRFYSPIDGEEHPFKGVEEFLLKVERLFHDAGYPQAYREERSFDKTSITPERYGGVPLSKVEFAEIMSHKGTIATLVVIVESRRNSTWQGVVREICVLDNESGNEHLGGVIGNYNGELEMINIVENYIKTKI